MLLAATIILALAGCGGEPPPLLPPNPPGVTTSAEYAFGDTVAHADGQAQKAVLEQIEPRFGKSIRVLSRSVDGDAEPDAIKAYYATSLAGTHGWKELPLDDLSNAWSFAFESLDQRWVVAIVVLNPRFAPEGGGAVPLSILTNLKSADGR